MYFIKYKKGVILYFVKYKTTIVLEEKYENQGTLWMKGLHEKTIIFALSCVS